MDQEALVELLQPLGFTQYEAQCYLGLLREHPLNGSQLSIVCGVPRSMVYQTLNRLEEKAAVVRLTTPMGEPQLYEPVAPRQILANLAARFQTTCERVEHELDLLIETPPADVVLNMVGADVILQRVAFMVRYVEERLALMGGSPELALLEADLKAAAERGVAIRLTSVGTAPHIAGEVTSFLGENVSAPTRFLLVIADGESALIATFPPDGSATAVLAENPILVRLFSAFLNTEYYLTRLSNLHPRLVGELLRQVLEPEDRQRYAHILRFFDQSS